MRVLLLGFGSIGRHLVQLLDYKFTAMVRDVEAHQECGDLGVRLITHEQFDEALGQHDLVVEAAGVATAQQFLPRVRTPFVLTSVGALADPATAKALMTPHLHVTNGAIGGLDVLEAVAEELDEISITTSKAATGLIQTRMTAEEVTRLEQLTQREVLFEGNPTEAIAKFPGNVNVAVALGYATRGKLPLADALDRVKVRLIADPGQSHSSHVIEASGDAGVFRFEFSAAPSPVNPATSGTTALSLAATIRRIEPFIRRG